jgi:hypothetical protein
MKMDRMASQVAERHLRRMKTAGEVRFIKDRGGDKNEWGWGSPGPTERDMQEEEFKFDAKNLKPLTAVLRAGLLSMGHALSAQAIFTRIKSAQVSPDGSLGGKGYIQKIPDMRRQLMNVCEALSSLTDTLYDEVKAPHWNPKTDENGNRERDDVNNIMDDVDEIRADPEGFAEKEEEIMDEESQGSSGKYARQKMASLDSMAIHVAHRYHEQTDEARA